MKRGEIWTGVGGDFAGKPRPVLVVQDDHFDATSSVTACPLTTTLIDAPLTRVPVEPVESGLHTSTSIMIDKVTTIRRARLRERIGQVDHTTMVAVERSLVVFLGIAG